VASLTLPPPAAPLALRLRNRLFAGPASTGISLALLALLALAAWRLFRWAVLDAEFAPDVQACRAAAGACWGVIGEKHRLVLLGRFPVGESWRPVLAIAVLLAGVGLAALPRFFNRFGLALVAGSLAAFVLLMRGGVAGLGGVTTDLWGGLPLTLFLTVTACLAGMPLGILLALARRSALPLGRWLATGYIELIRGVPLVTLLFFGAFVLPLLLPAETRLDPMVRIAACLVAFEAAYLAEVFRGGLQSIPRGQYEAAQALGMTRAQTLRLVVLPQALRLTIAPTTSNIIGVLKNTSLVAIVNVYDLTGALKLALGDAQWRPFFVEMYLLVCAIYLAIGLGIAHYGRFLERRYALDSRK
jgi:general L-amino acid transport system permease protein